MVPVALSKLRDGTSEKRSGIRPARTERMPCVKCRSYSIIKLQFVPATMDGIAAFDGAMG
jgi:hypothetical protein